MVFFSRNRFVIYTLEENWFGPQSTPDRLEAAVFLKDIVPPSHLPCLHFLVLVSPRLSTKFLASDIHIYHDWITTIEYVDDKLNFSKLTLRGRVIQEAYLRILAPFVRLVRPHRFSVDVGWLDEESYSEVVANLERKLEQSVMGEGYDNSRVGKGEERCSARLQYLKRFRLDDDADETDETGEDEEDEWLDGMTRMAGLTTRMTLVNLATKTTHHFFEAEYRQYNTLLQLKQERGYINIFPL